MTYTELVAAIKSYTENEETDFVAEIPNFVRQAEDRIQHMVQLPVFRKSQQGNMTAHNRFLTTPDDFIASFSVAVVSSVVDGADFSYLINTDVNFIREAFPKIATEAQPRFYALWDENTFILGPTPLTALQVDVHYYYKPDSIVTAGSTWLGTEAESALLYGCLLEAYTFMKGEADLMTLYDTRYKEALIKLKELGDGKNRQDAYRSGQTRMAVT
mgnify:CR=1 FL=1